MATQPIYQFYAKLDGFEPKIWRRFQIAGNYTVAKFAYVLMAMYQMQGNHMFSVQLLNADHPLLNEDLPANVIPVNFAADGTREFQVPHMDFFGFGGDEEYEDATAFQIKKVLSKPGDQLVLEYDFGDSWLVTAKLESIFNDKDLPARELPRVLEGEGYGIVEDCGGIDSLYSIRDAFDRGEGEEYEELCEWLGVDHFDLSAFSAAQMSRIIKSAPRFFKSIYENN